MTLLVRNSQSFATSRPSCKGLLRLLLAIVVLSEPTSATTYTDLGKRSIFPDEMPIDIDEKVVTDYYRQNGQDSAKLTSKKQYQSADDNFSLSNFVKDSIQVTKDVFCIDSVKSSLQERYQTIL